MTRNLSEDLSKQHIRINQINVGWTHSEQEHKTQIGLGMPENWHENIPNSLAPYGQLITPEQVAEHVIFWLSDASYPINGQVYECEQYPLIGCKKIIN